jgi:hypothetical protein
MRNWKSSQAAPASPSTGSTPTAARRKSPLGLRNVLTGLGHPANTAQEIDASLLQLQQVQQNPATAATDYRRLRCRS